MEHRRSGELRASKSGQTLGGRRVAMRMMNRKSTGVTAVYELDPATTDAGPRTLIFESMAVCTRVTQFPENWQRLTDDELAAIRRAAS